MKKDNLINQKLKEYSEIIKPNEWVIYDAVSALSSKNIKSKRGYFKYALVPLALMVIIVIGIISNRGNEGMPPSNISYYAKTSVERQTATADEFNRLTEGYKKMTFENSRSQYAVYKFKSNNEVAYLSSKSVVVTPYGTDIVRYNAEVTDGMSIDLKKYHNISYYKDIEGIKVFKKEIYENGEYISNIYFQDNGIEYCIEIMSPNQDMADYYLEIIF